MSKPNEPEKDKGGIWISPEIMSHTQLSFTEKGFLARIAALDNEKGCFATNRYFSDIFNLSLTRVSQIINELEKKGCVTIKHFQSRGNERIIKTLLKESCRPSNKKVADPLKGKFKHNKEFNKDYKYGSLSFLKEKDLNVYNSFIDTYKPQIDNWQKFETDLNNKCVLESIPLDTDKILARAKVFAGNWIKNQPAVLEIDPAKEYPNSEKAVQWFIDVFNNKGQNTKVPINKPLNHKPTRATTKLFNERRAQGYEWQDFQKATQSLFSGKNKWHKDKNYQFATPQHLLKENHFERYLNAEW
ncbi:MAG TPA: helix-turn-helix domain-containing protein [Leeuwenhoekiella sp.]|nr:helix-turn-helix domain-containing protein [Leeuwenhoekiella sp.]